MPRRGCDFTSLIFLLESFVLASVLMQWRKSEIKVSLPDELAHQPSAFNINSHFVRAVTETN